MLWDQRTPVAGLVALLVCVLAAAAYRSPPLREAASGAAAPSWLLTSPRVLSATVVAMTVGLASLTGKVQPGHQRPKPLGFLQQPSAGLLGGEKWRAPFVAEFRQRQHASRVSEGGRVRFPLASDTLDAAELLAGADAMLSGKLTMGARVRQFESELAAYLGVPCAVMVNSGSSANLIAVAGALELSGMGVLGRGMRRGDEVLVPALAWSTTLAPLVQLGLQPVLVDIDLDTLNMDVKAASEKVTGESVPK